jgi:hypothetical protein
MNNINKHVTTSFDFRDPGVVCDQNRSYDEMLINHPVARNSQNNGYVFFKYKDVSQILTNHKVFSSQASPFLFVPHGLDEPKHSKYRNAIATAFIPEKMLPLISEYEKIANYLVLEYLNKGIVDAAKLAFDYTAQIELKLLNWDQELSNTIIDWTLSNLNGTLLNDVELNTKNAEIWNNLVYKELNKKREIKASNCSDLTIDLINLKVDGNYIPDAELASLIRNLNMGLVSSMACNISNSINFFAMNQDIQNEVRNNLDLLDESLDEITRLHGSLVSSKRIATEDVIVTQSNTFVKKGEFVEINWCSANRDPDVFDNPKEFRWGRDHSLHLMYGKGIHECMGIQLARIQLKIIIKELLKKTQFFELDKSSTPEKLVFSANGYKKLNIRCKA